MNEEKLHQRIREELNEIDQEEVYDEMLDECHPEVEIGNLTFLPSKVLSECDPIAYRCGMSDYFGCCEDQYYELDGEYYYLHEVQEIIDELEDEEDEEE